MYENVASHLNIVLILVTGINYRFLAILNHTVWVQIKDIILSTEDRQLILNKQQLTDKHINGTLRLIHEQFPTINGLV